MDSYSRRRPWVRSKVAAVTGLPSGGAGAADSTSDGAAGATNHARAATDSDGTKQDPPQIRPGRGFRHSGLVRRHTAHPPRRSLPGPTLNSPPPPPGFRPVGLLNFLSSDL